MFTDINNDHSKRKIFDRFIDFLQLKLLFNPQPDKKNLLPSLTSQYDYIESLVIHTEDGADLHGWFAPKFDENGIAKPLKIYFGGRGEEVSWLIPEIPNISNFSVALFNYRGSGKSTGTPSQSALYNDSLRIFEYFVKKYNFIAENIGLIGRSLGTGLAIYVAANKMVKSVILISPYDSIISIAREKYWYIPISRWLVHHFKSIDYVPYIKVPLLTIVSDVDKTVRIERSKRIHEAWNHNIKEWIQIPFTDHSSVASAVKCIEEINRFH